MMQRGRFHVGHGTYEGTGQPCIVVRLPEPAGITMRMPLGDAETLAEAIIQSVRDAEKARESSHG